MYVPGEWACEVQSDPYGVGLPEPSPLQEGTYRLKYLYAEQGLIANMGGTAEINFRPFVIMTRTKVFCFSGRLLEGWICRK